MASTYLERSISSTGNRQIMTFSAWIKRATAGATNCIFSTGTGAARDMILFESDGKLQFSKYNGGYSYMLKTNRQFRDLFGWYHIVCVLNTPDTTADDRMKIYVNGVEETSFATRTNPTQDYNSNYNTSGNTQYLGQDSDGSFDFNGCMSHVHYVDGTAYTASTFGEFDSNGVWTIKTSPTVTYGTNGFFLLKDNASVTDQSGQGNNFSVGAGTLTKTEDNPSDVFATINPLFVNDDAATNALTNGANTYTSTTRGEWNNMTSTLGAVTGKYYWEVKYEQLINASTIYMASEGVASDLAPANSNLGEGSRSGYGYGWLCANRNTTSNTRYLKTVAGTSTLTTDSNNTPVVAGDIVGVAWDATNGKLWFHKNGTYIDDTSGNVGNPSSDANPYHTGMQTGILYTPWSDVWQNASGSLLIKSYNFGNGYFGTTVISSEGTNASGIGKFEYDVPTGYTALSTKGLNE